MRRLKVPNILAICGIFTIWMLIGYIAIKNAYIFALGTFLTFVLFYIVISFLEDRK